MNRKIIDSETEAIDPLQGQPQAIAGLHRQAGDLSSVPVELSIDAVERDEGLQARVKLDPDTITDYTDEMQHDTAFPPIVVFHEDTEDDTRYWLADGWHRVEAAIRLGAKSMLATVLHGNRRDALIYAAGANSKNGLRRTSADKRKAVEMLLHDEELVTQSDSELGRIAGVDRITVSNVRKKLEASCEIHMIEEKQVTRRGKTYTQKKRKEVPSKPERELQDHDRPQTHPPQAEDGQGQPEPEDSPSDARPETQASQAPLPALSHLLETVEDSVSDFRVQYPYEEPVVEEILGSLERELQRDRYILESYDQPTGDGGGDLDAEENLTPEPEATMAPDDPGVQGHPSPLEERPTTVERPDTFAVVQAFMKKRCMPSTDLVSHDDVMASIKTWLGSQGLPLLTEKEVIDALHRQGFRDEQVTGGHRERTASSYQWQGFQLLPSGAPDNEVDPFGSRHA